MNVKTCSLTVAALLAWFGGMAYGADNNPQSIRELLDRIGGSGASSLIETSVDESLASQNDGKETFIITSQGGKPCIKGSTLSAVTTGIGWYLNHTAKINLAWNNLTTTLSADMLPLPGGEEKHECAADYRYYLNYCTFSYSMSTWTWDRWQQEIDWMALHGINMPLQIVGLETVWRDMLVQDYGYTTSEANDFVAGPCFMAWFGMNNLEGWGGPNPEWWYTRQKELGQKINERMRSLGIEPVLPGFAGMVPSNFTTKTGINAINQGGWCGFARPYILDPNSDGFSTVAANYYKHLKENMGESQYYSIDPFHEGANTSGIDVPSAYQAIYKAMDAAKSGSQWVIQQWQWSSAQWNVLNNVPVGKLIVLDLFSDGIPGNLGNYKDHDVVYCTISNFGGRTGLMGRFNGVINGYFDNKSSISTIKGIGAAPEAIEQVPVLYDILFELPWYSSKPDPQAWIADYAESRYGVKNAKAAEAWELLRNSALNCTTSLQGPHEAVTCARPAWTVNAVSSWGGTNIFYDAADVASAAYSFLDANLSGENYSYDLTDISRQALTDYAYYLLQAIKDAKDNNQAEAFAARKAAFLNLIDDLDRLLGTNANFMLGKWTNMARDIANESTATTDSDRDWLELNNARTLITTWGERGNSESAGLRDYSYRQWNGMLKDYYKPRWEKFFNGESVDWFTNDWNWAHSNAGAYDTNASGDSRTIALELLHRYVMPVTINGKTTYAYAAMTTDLTAQKVSAYRGSTFTLPITVGNLEGATFGIDLNQDGEISANEVYGNTLSVNIPSTVSTGDVSAYLTLADGTVINFTISIRDEVTAARTITVAASDAARGTVAIQGAGSALSLTTKDDVTVTATAKAGFKFGGWTANGKTVSIANPYNYYGADDITLTAQFNEIPAITCGDWTLSYEEVDGNENAISITGVIAGSGALDLAKAETTKQIVSIAPDAFAGNTSLTSINLPAALTSIATADVLSTSISGDATERSFALDTSIAQGTSFDLTLKVSNGGASFNQWGSTLLGTGTEPFGAFTNGFQLYLKKAQTLTVKAGSETNLTKTVGTNFSVGVVYDASAKTLSVTVNTESGESETASFSNYTLADITSLCYALPEGVDITSLRITPSGSNGAATFGGCTSLMNITVDAANANFTSADGCLLNADGTELVAFPEGRLFNGAFRLRTSAGKYLSANPLASSSGSTISGNRDLLTDGTADGSAMWLLATATSNGKSYVKVKHLNSARFIGEYAASGMTITSSATSGVGLYSYSWKADGTACALTLTSSTGSELGTFTVETVKSVDYATGWNAIALPFAVELTEGEAYVVTACQGDALLLQPIASGTIVASGVGLLVHGATTLTLSGETGTKPSGNLLTASTMARGNMSANKFFTLTGDVFTRSAATTTEANSAFLYNNSIGNPEASTLKLVVDESAISEISVDATSADAQLFDLMGRKAATNPRSGIYINSNGAKVIIR